MWMLKQCLIGEDLGNAERGRVGRWGGCARLTLLWQDIQKSFGTTQAAMVCVGPRTHACMHMWVLMLGQAGRQGETSAVDPRAVLRG